MKRPTKAEKEFKGDCYGDRFSPKARECSICLVATQCSQACGVPLTRNAKDETMGALKMKKKNLKKVKDDEDEEREIKVQAPKKLSKLYKRDKKNLGLREKSAGWVIYQVLRDALSSKTFTEGELERKSIMFVKMLAKKGIKIKFHPDKKIGIMLRHFRNNGLIVKVGKDTFKKLI